LKSLFPSSREPGKPNGDNGSKTARKAAPKWPDLVSSLKSLDADVRVTNGAPSAARPETPRPNSNTGILNALGNLDQESGLAGNAVPVISARPWRNLAEEEDSPADLVSQIKQVAGHPRPAERVLGSSLFQPSAQESFQVLCHRLFQVRAQRRLQTILVTSPVPGEGKTVVSLNLATTLSKNSSSVLLVDADLRHPSSGHLGLDPAPGFSDYLNGRVDLAQAIRRVNPMGFYYLPSGSPAANPTELLQKPRLQELVNQASAAFEWIIFDSPSVNLFADARYLSAIADGVLVVVREGMTPKELAMKSITALGQAFILGMVYNASTSSPYAGYGDLDRPVPVAKSFKAVAGK